jgi:uncharacterized protein with ATP-grasp and redox domains
MTKPKLLWAKGTSPLQPFPLISSQIGSFSHYTVTKRMPEIIFRVIKENNFSPTINQNLSNLADELLSGYLSPLSDDTGIDVGSWNQYLQPYIGQKWLDIPWFLAETYFYRQVLQITNYFGPSEFQGLDPYGVQKAQGLESCRESIIKLCEKLHLVKEGLNAPERRSPQFGIDLRIKEFLYFALWGNRVDLSLWSAFEGDRSQFDIETQLSNILVDDTSQVIELLTNGSKGRVDIVVDNAGFELICDLCLMDFLLTSGLVEEVKLHLKPHPTFVSDAMIQDVYETIRFLSGFDNQEVKSFASRLEEYLKQEQSLLSDNYFWASPLAFWEIPNSLKIELSKAKLLIIKGDANYRRLLGDRHWEYTTPIENIITYLPAPLVALRTLKSQVVAGLESKVIKKLETSDPDWLIDGKWGVIQFIA